MLTKRRLEALPRLLLVVGASCVTLKAIASSESWMTRVMRFVFNSKLKNAISS